MTLTIFTSEPAQQAPFTAAMTKYMAARVVPEAQNTGGAAAAQSLQERQVSHLTGRFDHFARVTQSLIQDMCMDPTRALEKGIAHLIAEESDTSRHDSLSVHFAYTVLQNTQCFTLPQKQKLLQTIVSDHQKYDAIFSYRAPLTLKIDAAKQANLIAAYKNESGKNCEIQKIPHDFIIRYEFKLCTTVMSITNEDVRLVSTSNVRLHAP